MIEIPIKFGPKKSDTPLRFWSYPKFPFSLENSLIKFKFKGPCVATMAQVVEEWYKQMPIISRSYLTAAAVTTVCSSLDIWTSFNTCSSLADIANFLRRTISGGREQISSICCYLVLGSDGSCSHWKNDPLSESFARIIFLNNSLTFVMVLVWSKQNPHILMSFLGLFSFTTAYLPWVLLGFSILVGTSPWVDLLEMMAGHAYYFLGDVYPMMTGRCPLKTLSFIKTLFAEEAIVMAQPGDVRFAAPLAALAHLPRLE